MSLRSNGSYIGSVASGIWDLRTVGQLTGLPSGSRTLYVDGARTDTYTADGTILRPFKTIQAAHDYAATVPHGATSTAWRTSQVVIRINAGNYNETLTVTRPNIHFVGGGGAKTRDVIIGGRVTLNITENPDGTRDYNLVSFSNLIVLGDGSTTNTLFTAGGTASYLLFFANMHLSNLSGIYGGATCKTFEVTNTSVDGIRVEIRNMLLGQDYSSLVAMDLNNVSLADIDGLSAKSLGTVMELKTTYASIGNSKFQTTSTSSAVAVIRAISSFSGSPATLVLGNSILLNSNTNGDGIYIGSGAVANVGQVAFNIGTALGTGFAVNGVAGATLISAANTFGVLPVSPFATNNKVATAITNASLGTSLTRSGVALDTRTPASHNHDERYYTESEVNTLLAGKQETGNYATLVSVPASATATGTAGQIAYDSGFIYVCTAANTWVRVPLATW